MFRLLTTSTAAALTLMTIAGCHRNPLDAMTGPLAPTAAQQSAVSVDMQTMLVPPPGYPALDSALVSAGSRGRSWLRRSSGGITADARLKDQTPGHVLVYATIIFNRPEFCREGEDRLPEPGPCRGNGPLDPRDAAIPAVEFTVDARANAIVGHNGMADFAIDFVNDPVLQQVNGIGRITNPEGAVVFVAIMDKGPLAPEGLLRQIQTNTMYGGCQGPPANGSLPCRIAGLVQHLPGVQ